MELPHYPDNLRIEEALQLFFLQYNIAPDGGVNDKWIKLKLGKLNIPFPNLEGRKKAILIHDTHHILTGYQPVWKGEAALGAWEVSSGCGKYLTAWILDMGIFALGLFLFPKTIFNAFIRGRGVKNFFAGNYSQQQRMQLTVGEARHLLKLNKQVQHIPTHVFEFVLWWMFSFVISFLVFVAPVAYVVHLIVDK